MDETLKNIVTWVKDTIAFAKTNPLKALTILGIGFALGAIFL